MSVEPEAASIREELRAGKTQIDKAIWVDADVLVFDREGFDVATTDTPLFCREVWVAGEPECLRTKERINNSVFCFQTGDIFLDTYIDRCLEIVQDPHVEIGPTVVGTDFLSQMGGHGSLLGNVALWTPHISRDFLRGEGPHLDAFLTDFGADFQAVNLCHSRMGVLFPLGGPILVSSIEWWRGSKRAVVTGSRELNSRVA